MPASISEFTKAAEDSGILTADVLSEHVQGVAGDTDAVALANRLVKAGRLTAFQAKHIYGGKANTLVLGPYVVLDLLGKGGMGYVYKAEHRKMRRVVALKVIARTALKSPAAVQRFEREVQAAARLEHPNIVTAFDAGEAGGTHYLVMQFVDGRNLSETVKERGPQPVDRAVDWVLQTARGLSFAHEQGVIHRDIKPGNLLVDSRGTVKILDMGLARLETLDADQDQLTGTGQIMGTVDYMAPEQAMDTRQADARSDIYSLGVTLWYLLTGRPLFTGETVMGRMMAHMQTPAPALDTARRDVTPEIDAVFQRMVAKKPADRFQSMHEVIAALQSLLQSETGASSPSIAFGGGASQPGSVGTDPTQTLQRSQAFAVDEETARLSAVDRFQSMHEEIAALQSLLQSETGPRSSKIAVGGGASQPGSVGTDATQTLQQSPAVAVDEDTARLSAVDIDTSSGLGKASPEPRGSGGGLKPLHLAIGGGAVGALLLIGLIMFAFGGRGESKTTGRGGESAAQPASPLDAVASVAIPEPTTSPRVEPPSTVPPPLDRPSTSPPPAIAPCDATQARKHQEAWANHLGIEFEVTNSIDQKFVVIPPGKFTMGEGDKTVDVTLTMPFLLGLTKVTNAQWERVMGSLPSQWKDADRPVEQVSWDDAVEFCRKLSAFPEERQAGREYRLPTEAEWEYACRAGTTTGYSFGDDDSRLGEYGWFKDNSGGQTRPVGTKKPNAWGLFDMHGNVWEWCRDWYGDYGSGALTDPQGPSGGSSRVLRGGSGNSAARRCRSAYRFWFGPSNRLHYLGFRLALSPSGSMSPEADK